MRVQIAARHCEIPDSVRSRAEDRALKLSKYDPGISSAQIVFEVQKHRKKVEGILSVDGEAPVVAQGEADEFRKAVDQMADRLARMLRRRRDQRTDHQAGPEIPSERTTAS